MVERKAASPAGPRCSCGRCGGRLHCADPAHEIPTPPWPLLGRRRMDAAVIKLSSLKSAQKLALGQRRTCNRRHSEHPGVFPPRSLYLHPQSQNRLGRHKNAAFCSFAAPLPIDTSILRRTVRMSEWLSALGFTWADPCLYRTQNRSASLWASAV